MKHILTTAAAMVAVIGFGLATADAGTILPDNLDTLNPPVGSVVAGPVSKQFLRWNTTINGWEDVGDLVNTVYVYADANSPSGLVYTYTHEVTPQNRLTSAFQFNTDFGVSGFNGVAGWSGSSVVAAGGPSGPSAFSIFYDNPGSQRLFWTTTSQWWDVDETITFFFQSHNPPGQGVYNIVDRLDGAGESFAPVPLPPAGFLGLGLLAGMGLIARSKRRRKTS